MIFRLTYERAGHPHCMTFAAANLAMACDFAYTILQSYASSIGGSWIFSVSPCSVSGKRSR